MTTLPSPDQYEKLGLFYLGREYNPATRAETDTLLLYDSRDLVTHAVCVGMTGSGKTGLCLALLEEAGIDGIPAILIDPKGDLGNLLLTFPDLQPSDFRPWINEEEAARKGLSPDDFACQQAEYWRKGLAESGQSPDRIRRLREAVGMAIYTPGSTAGIPVSILGSFSVPPQSVRDDPERFREHISTMAGSLLGLLGISADRLRSREHILISTILEATWGQGRSLDLPTLIKLIRDPPFQAVGVLPVETFYPAKDRFDLVLSFNNLLASPGFKIWREGVPLSIPDVLYTSAGKPRIAIFSIAHLTDAERMFFVTYLLNEVISWMRVQQGTTSLRALLYMDEIFGFFPPVANPPSKQPLLTLLKQARAFGLGVILATQNPVDLDYKGLSNAGTWWIGRLQTDQDRNRLLDGLAGASTSSSGAPFDRSRVSMLLAGLESRVFLMHDIHRRAPVLFTSRFVMSYLRGPLTREQIRILTATQGDEVAAVPASAPPAAPALSPVQVVPVKGAAAVSGSHPPVTVQGGISLCTGGTVPLLPPSIPQYFLPVRHSGEGLLYYIPFLIGLGSVTFTDKKVGIDLAVDQAHLVPLREAPVPAIWDEIIPTGLNIPDLQAAPGIPAEFAPLPDAARKSAQYTTWKKQYGEYLFRNVNLSLLRSPSTGITSQPGESEGDLRVRIRQAIREKRDAMITTIQEKYAKQVETLQQRLQRAESEVDREKSQGRQQEIQTAISAGAALFSAFSGRKTISTSVLGRASTAARGVSRTMKEKEDIQRAEESADAVRQDIGRLEDAMKKEMQAVTDPGLAETEILETVTVSPKKAGINVTLLVLAWAPHYRDSTGTLHPAWEAAPGKGPVN